MSIIQLVETHAVNKKAISPDGLLIVCTFSILPSSPAAGKNGGAHVGHLFGWGGGGFNGK